MRYQACAQSWLMDIRTVLHQIDGVDLHACGTRSEIVISTLLAIASCRPRPSRIRLFCVSQRSDVVQIVLLQYFGYFMAPVMSQVARCFVMNYQCDAIEKGTRYIIARARLSMTDDVASCVESRAKESPSCMCIDNRICACVLLHPHLVTTNLPNPKGH